MCIRDRGKGVKGVGRGTKGEEGKKEFERRGKRRGERRSVSRGVKEGGKEGGGDGNMGMRGEGGGDFKGLYSLKLPHLVILRLTLPPVFLKLPPPPRYS